MCPLAVTPEYWSLHLPQHYSTIWERTQSIGFGMPSDLATGELIRCLVASKTNARVLELGTGTGLGTCWLLDGMDPGKYIGFDHSLRVLRHGGMLVIDDMLPQPNWPDDHPPKVERLMKEIDDLPNDEFSVVKLCWYTGHVILTKRPNKALERTR